VDVANLLNRVVRSRLESKRQKTTGTKETGGLYFL